MGFWFFMLAVALLVPVIMIVAGKAFLRAAPKHINPFFGYRTALSMTNQDTWTFAHRHCGRVWLRVGLILLPVSLLPMLFVIGQSQDAAGTVATVVSMVDTLVLVASIFPTEWALKKTFDANRNRI